MPFLAPRASVAAGSAARRRVSRPRRRQTPCPILATCAHPRGSRLATSTMTCRASSPTNPPRSQAAHCAAASVPCLRRSAHTRHADADCSAVDRRLSAVPAPARRQASCAPRPSTSSGDPQRAPPPRASAPANGLGAWAPVNRTGTSAILRWRAWVGILFGFVTSKVAPCARYIPVQCMPSC